MMLRTTFRWLLLLAMAVPVTAIAQQHTFTINGRVKVEGGPVDGTTVVVHRNGVKQRVLNTGLNKFSLELELNADYILSFEKNGFVTKKLSFNTRVPADAVARGFAAFDFAVSLFKQYDGVNTVVFNQPVGMIKYDATKYDFDYDTDYTRSIQSALDRAMEEVKAKQNDEKRGGADKAKEAAAAAAAEAKARAQAEAAARKEADEKARAEQKKAEEEKRATEQRRAQEEAEQRIAQRKADAAAEAEQKAEQARKVEEAKKRMAAAAAPPPPPVPVKAKAPPRPAVAAPPPRKAEPALAAREHAGADTRRRSDPVVREEVSPVRPAIAMPGAAQRPEEDAADKVVIRHEELIVEPAQMITLVRLDNGRLVTEYRKVVRKYGGTHYFKNGVVCSKLVYEKEAMQAEY